jgi:hypothetical protein
MNIGDGFICQAIFRRASPSTETMLSMCDDSMISGGDSATMSPVTRISPGDAYYFYFESHRPHRFRCVGRVPCEVVSACTPPTF